MSERQINDVKNLLENPTIDKEYVRHWIAYLGLKTFDLTL